MRRALQKFLRLRDEWNVPIFMGEGGENNKEWYSGAFALYEELDISWNFWTYKKMDTTNSMVSVNKPKEWDRCWLNIWKKELSSCCQVMQVRSCQ
jgi:endoglucanase